MKLLHILLVISLPHIYVCDQILKIDLIPAGKEPVVYRSVESESKNPRWDPFTPLKEKIQEEIERPIKIANQKIESRKTQVQTAVDRYLQQFKQVLEKKRDALVYRITEPTEQAMKMGTDIKECVGETKKNIIALSDHVQDGTTKCIKGKTDQATEIINRALKIVNNCRARGKNILNAVKNCESAKLLDKPECIKSAGTKIVRAAVEIPPKLSEPLAQSAAYIKTFGPSLSICTTGQIKNLMMEGGTIISDVGLCVSTRYPEVSSVFRSFDDESDQAARCSASSMNSFLIFPFLILDLLICI